MRKYIIETENIALSVDDTLGGVSDDAWRLTLNDKYGHYLLDVDMRKSQLADLLMGLKSIEGEISKEEFI